MTQKTNKHYRMKIENFLSVEFCDLDLDAGVTGFVGDNGAGKTNILTAVESILAGKFDERLIQSGKDRAEIKLEELNENEKVVASVTRMMTRDGSNVLKGNLPPNTTPKKWLSELLDEIAINPIRLISEDPVKYLKKHIKTEVIDEEKISFDTDKGTYHFDDKNNSFDECEQASEKCAIVRVATYQNQRHVKEVIEELRKNLPALPIDAPPAKEVLDSEYAEVLSAIKNSEVNVQIKKEHEQIIKTATDMLANISVDRNELKELLVHHDKRVDEIAYKYGEYCSNAKITTDKELKELELEFERKKMEINQRYSDMIAKAKESRQVAERKNAEEKIKVQHKYDETFAEEKRLHAKINSAKDAIDKVPPTTEEKLAHQKQIVLEKIAQRDAYLALEQRWKQVYAKEHELDLINEKYNMLDETFKWYKYVLPKKLIERAKLPVENLSFKDGELYVGDTVIHRLSTAERYYIAVKLAVALAEQKGQLLILIDGLEVFTKENREKLLAELAKANVRTLYTRHGKPENEYEIEVKRQGDETIIF